MHVWNYFRKLWFIIWNYKQKKFLVEISVTHMFCEEDYATDLLLIIEIFVRIISQTQSKQKQQISDMIKTLYTDDEWKIL